MSKVVINMNIDYTKPKFDLRKLRGRIKEVYGNETAFGKEMGWSHTTKTSKLNGDSYLKQDEILKSIDLLGIDDSSVHSYFFTKKV